MKELPDYFGIGVSKDDALTIQVLLAQNGYHDIYNKIQRQLNVFLGIEDNDEQKCSTCNGE